MQSDNRNKARCLAGGFLLLAGASIAAPAMALNCQYAPINQYQCSTAYVPVPNDILYWTDSAGGFQWGGTAFTASCDTNGFANVSLYRWNGRRFEVISSFRGMCLSSE